MAKYWQKLPMVAGLLIGLSLSAAPAAKAEESCTGKTPDRLMVRVDGVRNASGLLAITLYPDDPGRFMASKGRIARVREAAKKGSVEVCVPLPGPGHYAVLVHHDENGDRKMERSLIGMPEEGWGFSNNPSNLTGLPAFERVRFNARAGVTRIDVRINY